MGFFLSVDNQHRRALSCLGGYLGVVLSNKKINTPRMSDFRAVKNLLFETPLAPVSSPLTTWSCYFITAAAKNSPTFTQRELGTWSL